MMQTKINIREMLQADLAGVYAVQLSAFPPNFLEPVSMFEEILHHYDEVSYVAEYDRKVVGYILGHPADDDRDDFDKGSWDVRGDEECLYLHDLCLKPDYQGKGIAKMLYDKAEARARSLGFKKLIGISVQDTESFWTKMGFNMERPYSYNGEPGTFMVKELV